MKFFAEPHHAVRKRDRRTGKSRLLFRFDENGEFETDDARLIKKLQTRFEYEDTALEASKTPHDDRNVMVEQIHTEPIETLCAPPDAPQGEPVDDGPQFACKKCGYLTANRGDLLAHYRKEHPKKPKR